MGFRASVYRVMIISPGDVAHERDVVENAIVAWNDGHSEHEGVVFLPARWERSSPRQGAPGQDVLNEDLVDISDVGIAFFGQQIGTPTRNSPSGAVEEVRQFASAGKLYCVLFKKVPDPAPDTDQYQELLGFKREVHAHEGELVGLTKSFGNDAELQAIVLRYLSDTLARLPEVTGDAGLTLDQQRLLSAITQQAFAANSVIVNTKKLSGWNADGISQGRLQADLSELSRRDLLQIKRDAGEYGYDVQISHEGMRQGTRDLARAEERVRRVVCSTWQTTSLEVAEHLGLPELLVTTIAKSWHERGLVNVLQRMDTAKIHRPTTELCDWDKIRARKACLVLSTMTE
jgi:hypothetical protein